MAGDMLPAEAVGLLYPIESAMKKDAGTDSFGRAL